MVGVGRGQLPVDQCYSTFVRQRVELLDIGRQVVRLTANEHLNTAPRRDGLEQRLIAQNEGGTRKSTPSRMARTRTTSCAVLPAFPLLFLFLVVLIQLALLPRFSFSLALRLRF